MSPFKRIGDLLAEAGFTSGEKHVLPPRTDGIKLIAAMADPLDYCTVDKFRIFAG